MQTAERAQVLLVPDSVRATPTCHDFPRCLGSLTFAWKNYGKGPALDVEELDSYRPETWTLETAAPSGEPQRSRFTLPPGEVRPAAMDLVLFTSDRTTDRKVAKALKHGGWQVLAYVTYRDQFDQARHTRVGIHVARHGDGTLHALVAPLNNYAD